MEYSRDVTYGTYYVCGDAKMADDVFEVFMAIARSRSVPEGLRAVGFAQSPNRLANYHKLRQ
ncbi:hypothetical protein [Scytonema sp. HK-05]|uniref:hypothetical protein n=1 Tax=Scytonema sp. HK-05 TaxID=1137095 RepID=UPI001160EC3A|nr:hypothetical protein [Scytonema sp. HK-05]